MSHPGWWTSQHRNSWTKSYGLNYAKGQECAAPPNTISAVQFCFLWTNKGLINYIILQIAAHGSEIEPLISGKALGCDCGCTNTCTANTITHNERGCKESHRQRVEQGTEQTSPISLSGVSRFQGQGEMCCLSAGSEEKYL